LQRLTEDAQSRARRTSRSPLLVVDLDGFKAINDSHGHARGRLLQHFTLMAQTGCGPAISGAHSAAMSSGILLPASTLREGRNDARRLEVWPRGAAGCVGADVPISLSIGVAHGQGDRPVPGPDDGRRRPCA